MAPKELQPTTDLDPNVWYHISETRVDNYTKPAFIAMLQQLDAGLFVYGSQANQYWQFQPLGKPGVYAIRGSKSRLDKQLSVCHSEDEVDDNKTRPCMADSSGSRAQQWFVFNRVNDTIGFYNMKNGSHYYLDVHPGSFVFLSSNIHSSAYQPAQHWILTSQSDVNDGAYSTTFTDVPGAMTTSTHTPSRSKSDHDSPRSGLSSGAAAGIGIAAGLVFIALFFAACLLLRRRCRQRHAAATATNAASSHGSSAGTDAAATTATYSALEKPTPASPYSYYAPSGAPTPYPPHVGGGGSEHVGPQEMPVTSAPQEMPASHHTQYNELEASTVPASHFAAPHAR